MYIGVRVFTCLLSANDGSTTYVGTAMATTTQTAHSLLLKKVEQLLVALERRKKKADGE